MAHTHYFPPTQHYKYIYDFYSNADNIYFRYSDPYVNTVDITRVLTASVSATHLASLFPSPFPQYNSSELYPMAVRYADPQNHIYVIERPPFEVDIDFSSSKSYRKRRHPKVLDNKKMWIPWTVSVIRFYKNRIYRSTTQNYNPNSYHYEFYLFFNNKPLSSVDDLLIPAWLPNISTNGAVCMGQDNSPVLSLTNDFNQSSLTQVYNLLFNNFFSGWNADLAPTFIDTPSLREFRKNLQESNPKVKYPKNFTEPSNYWHYGHTSSNELMNILLTVSSMDYSQISSYIDDVISYSDRNPNIYKLSSLINRVYSKSNEISSSTVYQNYLLNNDSFAQKDYSYYFTQMFPYIDTTHFSLNINNVPLSFESVKLVNNPYLISCIYNKVKDHILDLPYNYSSLYDNLSLSFDYHEISHYLNTIEENANA